MKRGVLLFAHGARDPRWAHPFEAVARHVRDADPSVAVALSYLELMSPSLVEAGAALVAQGCECVDVVPLFLGPGGHVRQDLPVLVDRLRETHPQVRWVLRPTVGEDDEVIAAMARYALRAPETR